MIIFLASTKLGEMQGTLESSLHNEGAISDLKRDLIESRGTIQELQEELRQFKADTESIREEHSFLKKDTEKKSKQVFIIFMRKGTLQMQSVFIQD